MNTEMLALAKDLVCALEQCDDASADEILDQVAGLRETQLFKELGKLTRQLHDALVGFSVDEKITELTEHDIPDAKQRLHYVISMTEQAANQTLTAVENLLPISESLNSQSRQLAEKWNRFLDREMPLDEFKAMSQEISQNFDGTQIGRAHV